LATVRDGDVLGWLAGLATVRLNFLHDVHSFHNCTEHDMAIVQPRSLNSGDKELRTIRVGSGVSHRHDAWSRMLQSKIFVFEFVSVDGFASSTVVIGEITSLAHEVGDDAMECRALVSIALLTGAQSTEVLTGLRGDIGAKLNDDSADCVAICSHVEENSWQTHFICEIPYEISVEILSDVCMLNFLERLR